MTSTTSHKEETLTLQPLRAPSPPGAQSHQQQQTKTTRPKKKKTNKPPSLYEHAILKRATTGPVLAQTVSPSDFEKMKKCAPSTKQSFVALLRRNERVKGNSVVWGTLYGAWDFLMG